MPNPYVEALLRAAAGSRRHALLDRLLVAALIERRSCERFELLAAAASDGRGIRARLAALYRELQASERGHALCFLELARGLAPAEEVDARLAELLPLEAQAARAAPAAARIHAGPAAPVTGRAAR